MKRKRKTLRERLAIRAKASANKQLATKLLSLLGHTMYGWLAGYRAAQRDARKGKVRR